jgi:hypothetical protein
MELNGKLAVPAALPPQEQFLVLINRREGGIQSMQERDGEKFLIIKWLIRQLRKT